MIRQSNVDKSQKSRLFNVKTSQFEPISNADFSEKKREKWAFSARRRDVGEKTRRKQKGSIFLIIIGVYVNALIKIYAKTLLPQKSNRPYLLLIISNSGR